MNPILRGIKETINPKGGTNVIEGVVVIVIVGLVGYCVIMQIDIPPLIATAFGSIMGWLVKKNSGGDDE